MKVVIVLVLVSICHASVLLRPVKNLDDIGAAVQYRNQDSIGNYNFGYNEGHPSGGSFRKESGDVYGNKVGSYGLRDADGRLRIVNYVADANGFRADVKTNEPGVVPQDPASATFNKPSVVVNPVVAKVIPVPPPPPPVQFVPSAPVALPPPPPSVKFVPSAPVAFPPPPPPAVPLPPYTNGLVPYPGPVAPYKGYPPAPFSAYYGNAVLGKVGAPEFRGYAPPLAPPGYATAPFAYGFPNGKSLPSYQPLGFS